MAVQGLSEHRLVSRSPRAVASTSLASTALVIYTHLWIVEGAFRKWIPGADRPFYVARDALAVGFLVYLVLLRRDRSSRDITLGLSALASFVAYMLLSALGSPTSLAITLAGVRGYVAPIIAIFLAVLASWDVGLRVLRALLIWSPVNAVLAALQSRSAADAFVNRQASGESAEFEQFGAVRASGTFTAPAGLTVYVIALSAAALIFVLRPAGGRDRRWGIAGVVSTVAIVALGGSRGALLGVLIVVGFTLWRALVSKRIVRFGHVLTLVGASMAAILAARLFFPSVLSSFSERIANAAESEDTLARLWAQLTAFPAEFTTLLGAGPGVHSQAGIALGSPYGWIEADSGKFVAELGIVGLALAIGRLLIVVACLLWPFIHPTRHSLEVSVLTVALGTQQLIGGITQNPTSQGGFALAVALLIAAVRSERLGPSASPSARVLEVRHSSFRRVR